MKLSKKGLPLAPCGRTSFSENTVNKKYNSRNRNSENTNWHGVKLLELGRATRIVATALNGFDISLEAASTNERERIFRSTAWYALSENTSLSEHKSVGVALHSTVNCPAKGGDHDQVKEDGGKNNVGGL